tara:strand:- start:232 stop:1137 length:906 start_codon:yes stop_codon:yes gene_type:complete
MIHNDGLGDFSIKMLIDNREEVRDRLKRQLLLGRRDVTSSDNPDLYHTVNDLEARITVGEQSLKNLSDAADLVVLYGKAIEHLIEILQQIITLTIDTRQAGLTNERFSANLKLINNIENELKSAILLYKFKTSNIFDYKTIAQGAFNVEKRFTWDVSDNLLKRETLTLQKPHTVIGETLLYKESLVDSKTYLTTTYHINNSGNRAYLSYNLLVLENDIKKLRKDLDNINSFNSTLKAKRRLLLTVLDNNYRMLKDAVGIDTNEIQTKLNKIENELKTARETWKVSALNDPITNTVASLLQI